MERKIGEIFEFGGEWYQCLKSESCDECAFLNSNCIDNPSLKCSVDDRTDNCAAIFKKLEKWGGPYPNADKLYQLYRLPMNIEKLPPHTEGINLVRFDIVEIEIKQTKEDMEERKLIELLSEKVHNAWMKEKEAQGFSYGKDYDKEKKKHPDMLPYNELKEEVKEYDRATVRAVLQAQKELQSKYNYNNLKPFDIQKAREGKPVCTRDGRRARIICFDSNGGRPIVALVTECDDEEEIPYKYHCDGSYNCQSIPSDKDLMMLPEKKEGWVNVAKEPLGDDEVVLGYIFNSYEDAVRSGKANERYVATVRIEWEG